MKPYFQDHSAGWLFLAVVFCFFGMEILQFFRQREWREDAIRVASRSFWVGVAVWVVVATVILHRAGRYWPGAAIGHGSVVFTVGMVLPVAGAGLRWWSFWALGQYFTFTVDVSADQQVVTAGPYRMLRHPGYAGGLLAMIGIAVIYSNWVGLAGFTLSCLAIILWRVHIEETALLSAAGDSYRRSAEHRKRRLNPPIPSETACKSVARSPLRPSQPQGVPCHTVGLCLRTIRAIAEEGRRRTRRRKDGEPRSSPGLRSTRIMSRSGGPRAATLARGK